MIHSLITLNSISHSFEETCCFRPFSAKIHAGSRIGIVGRNGSGKSTLLRILQGKLQLSAGTVYIPENVSFGFVPQLVSDHPTLSGSERFLKLLTEELTKQPNVLCLDEPTNHLDTKNRAGLMHMLKQFKGTLIIISHDIAILRECIDEVWLIENHTVSQFSGNYDAFMHEYGNLLKEKQETREHLIKEKKQLKQAFSQELQRVARSKRAHKDEPDRKLLGKMKLTASYTEGKNKGNINKQLDRVTTKLSLIHVEREIKPTFTLNTHDCSPQKTIVSVREGSCGYDVPLLEKMQFLIKGGERIALLGDNGSGKTTFIKALMHDKRIKRSGDWYTPSLESIGYIDQQYATLNVYDTVLDALHDAAPQWTTHDIRRHLNTFLFSKNEQVHAGINTLSGGERARLSLAMIAAQSPKLLILDEITNNIDLETREHIINVLKKYRGAMIVISHDTDFLEALSIDTTYQITHGKLEMCL